MRRAAFFTAAVVVLLLPSLARAQMLLGAEFRANTYTTGGQRYASVASDSAGDFVVAWQTEGQDGSLDGIFAKRFSSAGPALGTEFRVNSFVTGDQRLPAVASDSAGAFVIVWESVGQDGSAEGIFGRRFSTTGTGLGSEFRASSYGTGAQRSPAVAADAGGDFVVVWESANQDGSDYGVFGRRFASNGAAMGTEFAVNSYVQGDQAGASIASDADGRFVVVWTSYVQDADTPGIFGQRFDSTGDRTGSEFRVNSYTPGYQAEPAIAADADGNFVVVWTSFGQDGDYAGVFGRRFASGGAALGSEFRLNSTIAGSQYRPAIAWDAGAGFVVVWNAYDGYLYGVFGRSFSRSGASSGSELQINSYSSYHQGLPAIAAGAIGNFVVVWNSINQDASGYGVFGRRLRDDDFIFGDGFQPG
ncbi:MAG: hypothetical protein ACREQQ_00350 [Candidatus Binatia bacterium]